MINGRRTVGGVRISRGNRVSPLQSKNSTYSVLGSNPGSCLTAWSMVWPRTLFSVTGIFPSTLLYNLTLHQLYSLLPCRWRQFILPKCWHTLTRLHDITTQNIVCLFACVRTVYWRYLQWKSDNVSWCCFAGPVSWDMLHDVQPNSSKRQHASRGA
jgi:hypothetical protein